MINNLILFDSKIIINFFFKPEINSNHFPTVVINFTDIRGKMLFERGNDEKNPYNLFFTFPYPKFLLTYKGYYGKSIEMQLALLKSNRTDFFIGSFFSKEFL